MKPVADRIHLRARIWAEDLNQIPNIVVRDLIRLLEFPVDRAFSAARDSARDEIGGREFRSPQVWEG